MTVGRTGVQRNLGFDPITIPAPTSSFAVTAAKPSGTSEDLEREIIDFDSEDPEGMALNSIVLRVF